MSELAQSFGAQAAAYDRGRPDYPGMAVSWLVAEAAEVVDVGAGTGKLTRVLIGLGRTVTAVEPDPKMRSQLATSLPGVACLAGTGEQLPLPDASADAITFGQAWHWVEPVAGWAEADRVLRPDGVLGLIWNSRDVGVEWVQRLTTIIGPAHGDRMATEQPPLAAPFDVTKHRVERWTRQMTHEGVLDLVRSRSTFITAGDAERTRMLAEVTELLASVTRDTEGTLELPYVTNAWRCTRG